MTGGSDGTKIKKLTSSCQWLVKATCGALGLTYDTTATNFVDADFNLYVLEYTKEFTTSDSVTLSDGWWPHGTKMTNYWDDANAATRVNGEGPTLTIADNSYSRSVPTSFIKNWLNFIDKERKEYDSLVGEYEAAITAFNKDKTNANRPNYLPK